MGVRILYFDTIHAIKVHDWIIDNSGGLHGNREIGLLDSALEHIQNDLYYPDFKDKLKHLIVSVNKFHPFIIRVSMDHLYKSINICYRLPIGRLNNVRVNFSQTY